MSATRRGLAALGLGLLARPALAGSEAWRPYETPGVLAKLPFGSHSHWLQPWRETVATRPASAIAAGFGVTLDKIERPVDAQAIALLAQAGVRTARIEINWGSLDYEEREFAHRDNIVALLRACRAARIRPLILLNAHHAKPAPRRDFTLRSTGAAPQGARELDVNATEGVTPGLTGICNLTEPLAPQLFVTRVEGRRLLLSKPLPRAVAPGETLAMTTLRYAPFSTPGTPRMEATIAGWLRYVEKVADLAAAALGTEAAADPGFDLEIWNELTFGHRFLSIANYYEPSPERVDERAVWAEIANRTAEFVAARRTRFAGVALANGFGNTVPWIAASQQRPAILAISKHPYPEPRRFPEDERPTRALDAEGNPTRFVPRYQAYFPEHYAHALQTETLLRDLSDTPNPVQGAMHGRTARGGNPVDVWITEIGVDPQDLGIRDAAAAERLKTKFALRAVLFHLGIGVGRVYLYRAFGDTAAFALLPRPPRALSPALQALGRAMAALGGDGAETPQLRPRSLGFALAGDEPGSLVFEGDGTPGAPALTSRDCLALLPVQLGASRFAVIAYVVTRDVRTDLAEESHAIRISGLRSTATVRGYDPLADAAVPSRIEGREDDALVLRIAVTDTPRLLLIEETAA